MSKDFLLSIFNKVKEKGILDEELVKYFDNIFLDKSINILEVIKRGITKYRYKPSNRTIWTAIGQNDEYLIHPKMYCSCKDFHMNVVIERKRNFCKHILAQIICEALDNYQQVELEDYEFKNLIEELKLNI